MDTIRKAAIDVLLHNLRGPYQGLPRTAGWGYPEPYTRDWMIAALGILTSKNEELIQGLRRMLVALASIQTELGHIPSLAHDPKDCGASDTTPLFLMAAAFFRSLSGEGEFLQEAVEKAMHWLLYQSPDDMGLIAQQPTSDWRDEQWVWGYGLYVNALSYACFRLYGLHERAQALASLINQPSLRTIENQQRIHEGLGLADKPYYAFWVYKIHRSERFDLLGNSLAILFGLAQPQKSLAIVEWVESMVKGLQDEGQLVCDLPPCFMPYIFEDEADWLPRYELYNRPGEYHNGGIWPFVAGFYISALVAAGQYALAEQKMVFFDKLVRASRTEGVEFGFNEWFRAQDCSARGQDWQSWSAAMYLYAAECVKLRRTPLIDTIRLASEGE